MRTKWLVSITALTLVALPFAAQAQGTVRGAQEGAGMEEAVARKRRPCGPRDGGYGDGDHLTVEQRAGHRV